MSLKQKTLSGLTWSFTQHFGIVGLRFVAQILLARIIAPEDFGLFALILIFNALGKTIADSGMGQSLIRSTRLTEKDYSTVFVLNLGVSLLFYALVYTIAPWVAQWYEKEILTQLIRLYSIAVIFSAFSTIQIHRLTKQLKFKQQTLIQLPSVLISSILGVVLAYLNYGVYALVWMEITFAGLLAIQFWIFSDWRPTFKFDIQAFQRHFKFGSKLLVAGTMSSIMNNIYPMIIGKFNPIQQVGFFTRATSMMIIPVGSIMAAMGKVTYPVLADVQHDTHRLKGIYQQMLKLAMLGIVPLMVLLILLAEPLMVLLITDVWLPAVPYFQLMCIAGMIYPLHLYNLNMLKVKGRSDLFLKAEVYKNILGILVLLITAPFGIYPMIYGILFTSFISLLINQYYSSKVLPYSSWEQSRDSLGIACPGIVLGALLFGLITWIDYPTHPLNYILHLFLITLIFVPNYLLMQKYFNPKVFAEAKDLVVGFLKRRK